MKEESLKILKHYWGFDQFKGSQEAVIEAVLGDQDVLALMPTAGGKSVCFQLPTLQREGICIVISPLVALIQDQVLQLKKKDIKAVALIGSISREDLNRQLDNCVYGKYKFLYLSPERLQQPLVQERIGQMDINLIAIDEAHCISQWGHDFRPAYLGCSVLRDLQPSVNIIALTATATSPVIKDIIDHLELDKAVVIRESFIRKNISFQVIFDENKNLRLFEHCSKIKNSAIVYVRTRRMTLEIAKYLQNKGLSVTSYHGGLPREQKEEKLENWMQNKLQIMVATNAFGMGVDKADVELVVHYQIPDCLENYYQEAGRAGRDGSSAKAVLISNPSDELAAREQFFDTLPDVPFLRHLYRKLNNYFQVSYGEGKNDTFRLNLNGFCEAYGFQPALTYNGLATLDQYSVISLSQSFSRRTHIQFIVGKKVLMAYLEKNQNTVPVVQNILRTYGGIFDFNTPINTGLISKKSGISEEAVAHLLDRLKKDRIVDYEAGHSDLEITFLVPREDDHTIHAFAHKLKDLHRTKEEKFEAMMAYIKNGNQCRNIQLLRYFGEIRKEACGTCDVCIDKKKVNPDVRENMEKDILGLLASSNKTSRQLINILPYREHDILSMLQNLLEEDMIGINAKNEYLRLS